MRGIKLRLEGDYGHFKRPEMNNNKCSYALMHKVAFIGLMGSIIGCQRTGESLYTGLYKGPSMRDRYSELCKGLLYSIKVLTPVTKVFESFTKRTVVDGPFFGKRGRYSIELIKSPKYEVTVALGDDSATDFFDPFCHAVKNNLSVYGVSLGGEKWSGTYSFLSDVIISDEKTGEFDTSAVFSKAHKMVDFGTAEFFLDRVPVSLLEDRYYDPVTFVDIIIPGMKIKVSGNHRIVQEEKGEECSWFM